jgi:hypothetical protein
MRSKKFLRAEQAALPWDMPGLLAGVDEAGRGPLSGPVVAAAVILDDQRPIRGLADSKKLSAARRERLADEIRASALCTGIGLASVEEIDQLNILQATLLAMQRAVQGLRLKPAKVLVDGNRLPRLDMRPRRWWAATRVCPPSRPRRSWPKSTVTTCAWSTMPGIPATDLPATKATARPNTCVR